MGWNVRPEESAPSDYFGGIPELVRAALEDKLAALIVNSMKELIQEGGEQVQTFAIQMAHSATTAALRGNTEWVEEIKGQVDLMLEINRIKITKKNRRILMGFLHGLLEATLKVALAVGTNYLSTNVDSILGRIK